MEKKVRAVNLLIIIADVLGAMVLAIYALLIGPLGVLRGPLVVERFFTYIGVLAPYGLLARGVRTAIDWRMGNFDNAIAQLESLIGVLEKVLSRKKRAPATKRVLADLYSVLARAYMHSGHIDDAMLVVIRSKKSLGLERLPGLADLDAKTAHLVRAGLAAGRLLDNGGIATLFVKADKKKPSDQKAEGVVNTPSGQDVQPDHKGAKIIPFPTMDHGHGIQS